MTNFKEQIFINPNSLIDDTCDIIFVADQFVEDYVGGAELTSQALLDSSPFKIQKIRSNQVNLSALAQGSKKFWIFGNFAGLNAELIPSIIANIKYCVLEYDYKFCKFRSPEKHEVATGSACDCRDNTSGKLVSAFFYGAQCLWWMSEAQKNIYLNLFPFLTEKDNIVLSSVFSKETLGYIKYLKLTNDAVQKQGYIVLGSTSWIKGAEAAKQWCEDNKKSYEVLWNVPYNELLKKMSVAEGFVYLPVGADTCPRMVIEAKLLGCVLKLNNHVQHKDESWFDTDNIDSINDYLYASTELFWNGIRNIINYRPKISGYTQTRNCIEQNYPWEQSIKSLLGFCDEVVIVDGGSTDGTWEKLNELSQKNEKLKVKQVVRDWSHQYHAVFDGAQKAEARSMCTGDFCWQMDSDEIVHENDAPKILELCKRITPGVDIISLPVIEYWGGPEKIRCDIQPWKWRLSKNASYITHGIPAELRRYDDNGNLYAAEGTDGCDMIHKETGARLPHVTFHTNETEALRQAAAAGNKQALVKYQEWFSVIVKNIPGVHHYSWYNITRKIKLYRDYWTQHWNSLYNKSLEDTAETNMMFNVPWSEVTDEMIELRSCELKQKTGGWIWHRKWSGESTPHITIDITEPKNER